MIARRGRRRGALRKRASLPIHPPERNRPTAEEAIQRAVAAWLPRGDAPLLVGASGGRDSAVLLAAAARVLGERVVALHVDHGLRADSDENRASVEAAARALGVGCVVTRLDVGGATSETALRRARGRAFARVSARHGHAPLLVAHHLDDALETVALNLARGHRTARGLAGVPTVRPLDAHAPLLRPFLAGPRPLTRSDLAADAARLGTSWRDDPTNADRSIPRNAVRAWLAADGAPDRARLDAVMARARARLTRIVATAAAALADGLAREGLGSRWFGAPPPDAEHLAELLRLYGWTLATPRRVDPRGPVVDDLAAALRAGSGRVLVPARPHALELHVGPRGFHAPGAALPPRTSARGLAVAAVARTSCFA